jgi:hypothetical protein
MKKFFFLLTGSILVSLFGCNKDEGPFVYSTAISDSTIMSFSKDIQPIFNSNCVACHTELHAKLNLMPCCSYTQLTSSGYSAPYIDTITPENSNIYKHLKGVTSIMPPSGKISEEQISKILIWIKQGGTNN